MAKLISKKNCQMVDGKIVYNGCTVSIDRAVIMQFNKLETMVQQYLYLAGQPAYSKAPSLDGFERKSLLKAKRKYVGTPDTPMIDKRTAEAMAYMAEVDAVENASKVNEMIDRFGKLIDWAAKDAFFGDLDGDPCVIDTPELGNPLDLDDEDIIDILDSIVKNPIGLGEMED